MLQLIWVMFITNSKAEPLREKIDQGPLTGANERDHQTLTQDIKRKMRMLGMHLSLTILLSSMTILLLNFENFKNIEMKLKSRIKTSLILWQLFKEVLKKNTIRVDFRTMTFTLHLQMRVYLSWLQPENERHELKIDEWWYHMINQQV